MTWETIWVVGTITELGSKERRLKIRFGDGHELQMNIYIKHMRIDVSNHSVENSFLQMRKVRVREVESIQCYTLHKTYIPMYIYLQNIALCCQIIYSIMNMYM